MRNLFVLASGRFWLRPLAWLACLLLPALAGAQQPAAAEPAPAAPAAAFQAATAPLAHAPMPAHSLRSDEAPTDWRAAHQAVGAFPRGHADIVRWEARQGSAPAAATPAAPHQGHKP